jgi:hypothetical protein
MEKNLSHSKKILKTINTFKSKLMPYPGTPINVSLLKQ